VSGGRPFDAVLCDLDGVLRLWDGEGVTELDRACGLPEGTLAGVAFRPERLLPAVTGAVTDEEWRSAVAEDLAAVWGLRATVALMSRWKGAFGRVDDEVRALLAAARHHVPVVLVSNATSRLEADLARLGLAGDLDGVVNTSRLGFAKPDARVFAAAAAAAGVPASRCLFVDDTEGHVAAARTAGMTGLHYREVSQLRAALAPVITVA
jgi:putative hydrolase of the HAD superfamily